MIALGDVVARALKAVGITKERVQAVTGSQDCGCAKRQASLNNWGFRWQSRLYRLRHSEFFARLRVAKRHLVLAWMALSGR